MRAGPPAGLVYSHTFCLVLGGFCLTVLSGRVGKSYFNHDQGVRRNALLQVGQTL